MQIWEAIWNNLPLSEIRQLIEADDDLNNANLEPDTYRKKADPLGRGPVILAIRLARPDVVRALMTRPACRAQAVRQHAACVAIRTRQAAAALTIIEAVGNEHSNRFDSQNYTPLARAADTGLYWVAVKLLDKGADPHAQQGDILSAFGIACKHGRADILRAMLKARTRNGQEQLNDREKELLAYHALQFDSADLVEMLVEFGFDAANWRTPNGHKLAREAYTSEKHTVLQILIEKCDDPGAVDVLGEARIDESEQLRTTLNAAIMSGRESLVSAILDRARRKDCLFAVVNHIPPGLYNKERDSIPFSATGVVPPRTLSPLYSAILSGRRDILDLLTEAGLDTDLWNENGIPEKYSPQVLADERTKHLRGVLGKTAALQDISSRELTLSVLNDLSMQQGLHTAIADFNIPLIRSLLGFGTDPDTPLFRNAPTPLAIVADHISFPEAQRIFHLLLEGGADINRPATAAARRRHDDRPGFLSVGDSVLGRLLTSIRRLAANTALRGQVPGIVINTVFPAIKAYDARLSLYCLPTGQPGQDTSGDAQDTRTQTLGIYTAFWRSAARQSLFLYRSLADVSPFSNQFAVDLSPLQEVVQGTLATLLQYVTDSVAIVRMTGSQKGRHAVNCMLQNPAAPLLKSLDLLSARRETTDRLKHTIRLLKLQLEHVRAQDGVPPLQTIIMNQLAERVPERDIINVIENSDLTPALGDELLHRLQISLSQTGPIQMCFMPTDWAPEDRRTRTALAQVREFEREEELDLVARALLALSGGVKRKRDDGADDDSEPDRDAGEPERKRPRPDEEQEEDRQEAEEEADTGDDFDLWDIGDDDDGDGDGGHDRVLGPGEGINPGDKERIW